MAVVMVAERAEAAVAWGAGDLYHPRCLVKDGEMLPEDLPPRIAAKIAVNPETGCWEWTGPLRDGYGRFHVGGRKGRTWKAHRLVYSLLIGNIPKGIVIDHLCRVRCCVNPAHLEPVTNRENILRGTSPAAMNARKTHCPQGHPYVSSRPGQVRTCNPCAAIRARRSKARKRNAIINAHHDAARRSS